DGRGARAPAARSVLRAPPLRLRDRGRALLRRTRRPADGRAARAVRAAARSVPPRARGHVRGPALRRKRGARRRQPPLVGTPRGDRSMLEEQLAALIFGAPSALTLDPDEVGEAARLVRHMVRDRAYRGSGGLRRWYPRTLAAWPGDLDELCARFCASTAC